MPACMEIFLISVSDKTARICSNAPVLYSGAFAWNLFIFKCRELHFLLFQLFNLYAHKRDGERHQGQFCFVVPTCLTCRPRLSSYGLVFVAVWVCREWRDGRGRLLWGDVFKVLKQPQLTHSFKSAAMEET